MPVQWFEIGEQRKDWKEWDKNKNCRKSSFEGIIVTDCPANFVVLIEIGESRPNNENSKNNGILNFIESQLFIAHKKSRKENEGNDQQFACDE